MRILEGDLQAHVTNVLMNIKHAVEDARSQGLIAELPDKVDFEVEIVTGYQSLHSSTTSNDTETSDGTETKGVGTMTRTEGASVEVTVESPRQMVVTENGTSTMNSDDSEKSDGSEVRGAGTMTKNESEAVETQVEDPRQLVVTEAGGSKVDSNDSEHSTGKEIKGAGQTIRTEGVLVETQVKKSRSIVSTKQSSTGQETDINSSMGGGDHTKTDYTY